MSFDSAWNDLHAKRAWGVYPNEHLVRFVKREFAINISSARRTALDIGCGGGAQSNMLAKEGFFVRAVEQSSVVAGRLMADWDVQRNIRLYKADITKWHPSIDMVGFDLIVDVCTLQHLPFDHAKAVIARAHSWLKPGGWFFSFMASHEFDMECEIQPRVTRFVELAELFNGDWKLAVGHENVMRPQGGTVAHWIIEAQKAN